MNIEVDEREDLYVGIVNGDQVWRRRAPKGYSSLGSKTIEPMGGATTVQYLDTLENFSNGYFDDEIDSSESHIGTRSPDAAITQLENYASRASELAIPDIMKTVSDDKPIALPTVLGTDSRYPVTGSAVTTYPGRTHGVFVRTNTDLTTEPLDGSGSGTKISARVVLTAGHVLYWHGYGWIDRAWIPGADGIAGHFNINNLTPNGVKYSVIRFVHPDWYDDASNNDDIGWFVLRDNQNSCDLGNLGAKDEAGLANDTVNLWSYPTPWQTCANSPFTGKECWSAMYRTSCTITSAFTQTILHDCDTQEGQSGGGIYKYVGGSRYVVAVHTRHGSTRNSGLRLNNNKMSITNDIVNSYKSSICE